MNEELIVRKKIRRPRRLRARRPRILYVAEILKWCDLWMEDTADWPRRDSGYIPGTVDLKWSSVEHALRVGGRGLPGGSSLARLLAEHRGKRNPKDLPSYSTGQILAWADAHYRRTGNWPTIESGPIPEAPAETWQAVNHALRRGARGLPGGSSLPRLLARHRGVLKQHRRQPPLTIEQILQWADAHYRRTGAWPRFTSGRIPEVPGESWGKIDLALKEGLRGLPGGRSLATFLWEYRGVRNIHGLPDLTIEQILAWADAHHQRTGQWPTKSSGLIPDTCGETWAAIESALRYGKRGLSGSTTLPRFLAEHRGVQNRVAIGSFTIEQILALAEAHFERTGRWPNTASGPVAEMNWVTWRTVGEWLRIGRRGLPGGSSLRRLLQAHGRVRLEAVGCRLEGGR